MADSNKNQIILAVIGLVGILGGAVIANWDKFSESNEKPEQPTVASPIAQPPAVNSSEIPATETTLTATGNNNLQIAGSNNIVNPLPVPKACRDKSHGIERYARTFDTDKTSHWMGGGYSQDPWCNDVISELRGEHPDGEFVVLDKSEKKKNTCSPANCPNYQYYCKVRVNTEPIYFEKLTSACG